jgi:hypothetical protein
MKKLLALAFLCMAVVKPSLGAEHLATRSAKVVGHASYKVGKGVTHAGVAVVKFVL